MDDDFVELPRDVEMDADGYSRFIEEQANATREAMNERKRLKKLSRQIQQRSLDVSNAVKEEQEDVQDVKSKKESNEKKSKKKKSKDQKRKRSEEPSAEKQQKVIASGKKGRVVLTEQEEEEEVEGEEFEEKQKVDEIDPLQKKLMGARFRMLNEQLYSMESEKAVELYGEHPELFEIYHNGFTEQATKWPLNPVDFYISYIKKNASKNTVICDFGCGDAKIARSTKKCCKKIFSLDLVALNDHVTACDMAKSPLESGSVDIAIFCLSLMGTNWEDFVREAHRVLKKGGKLMITEVASRIEDAESFKKAVVAQGFDFKVLDYATKAYFIRFEFVKNKKNPSTKSSGVKLKVCKYKKR